MAESKIRKINDTFIGYIITLASGWTDINNRCRRDGNTIFVNVMASHANITNGTELKLCTISDIPSNHDVMGGTCAFEGTGGSHGVGTYFVNGDNEIYVCPTTQGNWTRANVSFTFVLNAT